MSGSRRYDEDEVRAIFDEATRSPSRPGALPAPAERGDAGLTLAELQEIGREVGLAPTDIERAARSLDRRPTPRPRRTFMGIPMSAGTTVDLPRAPTDREWEQLVAELRETFQARGKTGGSGHARHWSNGNLHAFVEPTADGYRLRLGTFHGQGAATNRLGVGALILGIVMAVAMLITEPIADDLITPLLMALFGAGALTTNALRLPRWARTREQQMAHIAERAQALLAAGAREDEGAG